MSLRSAPCMVTKVRSALGSTSTTHSAVSSSSTALADQATPSAWSASRTMSPFGPVPMVPACTHSAPERAAATRMLTAPPASWLQPSAMEFCPLAGSARTWAVASTRAWPVWITRDMAEA